MFLFQVVKFGDTCPGCCSVWTDKPRPNVFWDISLWCNAPLAGRHTFFLISLRTVMYLSPAVRHSTGVLSLSGDRSLVYRLVYYSTPYQYHTLFHPTRQGYTLTVPYSRAGKLSETWNLDPQNAIFEFQEFEMQFLDAIFFVGSIKMKWELFSSKLLLGIKCISLKIL